MDLENKNYGDGPLISVVIPTYNRQCTLGRAIYSVLNQTYKKIELIVVDDASTDKTDLLIKSINDPRLSYIKLEANRGANHARNIGIERASGEYIAFQDSDDEWLAQKLEKQIELIESSEIKPDVVYCSYLKVKGRDASYLPKPDELHRKGSLSQKLLQGNFITTQSLLVKSDVFKEVGLFDEDMKRLQDWELLLRIANNYELSFLDKPLLITYFSEGSITSKPHLLPEAFLSIYKKHFSMIKSNNSEAIFCIQIAKSFINSGNIIKAIFWSFKAIKLSPWKISLYISFIFIFFGKKGVGFERKITRLYQKHSRKF